ncbi:hypothetical protein BAUCODRAFT_61939 [Baudoinia panamericana UAMH 10762]|uniref:PAC domain-containing protein n=1 Tax=Baudoinia panamericana (strain UAMH 10762) TaxID=717646 RepID=M2MV22_BAUPA|nr:uncharacterized protein BAUCODRAFT_61939 [Baudoinia panamericana UAMH 10762]EMD00802.1 hypothetical protein BAUCODRAFT_61939 [Baudoinia panamericana UAMH 10762]
MSAAGSVSPPSVFDHQAEEQPGQYTQPTTVAADEPSYDLKPPPPSVTHDNVEALAGRFFSADHLDTILRDHTISARFTRFLNQYRPQHVAALTQYLETKKAITAVEYANAIADQVPTSPGHPPYVAATLDDRFEAKSKRIVEDLVDEALPAYVTHRLVTLVTDTLVKEVTGNSAPIMRELVPSLAEVYCVTDPSLPDNPIVYASEEFYNTTQYGRDYVIGRNCRFLQGPKSSNSTVRRLIEALTTGQEICETILNYRRDGSPFMNLLMIAPLYDNKGQVRYFLGCQIDVSQLVEGGRGLESFSQLLAQDRTESRFGGRPQHDPKHMLGELGQLITEEESNIIKDRSRRYSEGSKEVVPAHRPSGRTRRILGMEETQTERTLWPHPSLGPSGRLPGVYQNYLLVRPFPSLRITFTSPALRIPGLLQTKFLDRIGGPQQVREGILDALSHGTGVTAKISWLTNPTEGKSATGLEGKPRWIHCTPLLGSDERVGVWMIVMVENEEVTGQLNRNQPLAESGLGSPIGMGAASPRFTGNKLYAEYLRREGKATGDGSTFGGSQRSKQSSALDRERREVDDQFRDF